MLVLSVDGYEKYFQDPCPNLGTTISSASKVCGRQCRRSGKNLSSLHKNLFIKDKFEYGALIEISRLRERMEQELAKEATKGKNVKLGFGGLADIEFVVQILQLMHGNKFLRLRETNTLLVLTKFNCTRFGRSGHGRRTSGQLSLLKKSGMRFANHPPDFHEHPSERE